MYVYFLPQSALEIAQTFLIPCSRPANTNISSRVDEYLVSFNLRLSATRQ